MRPISLCNVLYKIVSKTLANRLKRVVGDVVGGSWSVFIKGRLISDNVLVVAKVNHYLKRKRQGKTGTATLNINMSKAYDRMEWGYLCIVMVTMVFAAQFVDLIWLCVSSVRYFIAANGQTLGPCIPKRGLCQGDPFSPYLFILWAEGLSALINDSELKGQLHGCKVARGAPSISHLFFADDSFFFFRSTKEKSETVKQCLYVYELASGQCINFQKSSLTFNTNTIVACRQEVCGTLQVAGVNNHGLYLGLPSFVDRNKHEAFAYIKDRVW